LGPPSNKIAPNDTATAGDNAKGWRHGLPLNEREQYRSLQSIVVQPTSQISKVLMALTALVICLLCGIYTASAFGPGAFSNPEFFRAIIAQQEGTQDFSLASHNSPAPAPVITQCLNITGPPKFKLPQDLVSLHSLSFALN
jgi:hypothetical protein